MNDITFSPAALQLVGAVLMPILSALVAIFWLLYRALGERCARAERQVDTILPALEKLTDMIDRQDRGRT